MCMIDSDQAILIWQGKSSKNDSVRITRKHPSNIWYNAPVDTITKLFDLRSGHFRVSKTLRKLV